MPREICFANLEVDFFDEFKISNVIKTGIGRLWNVLMKIKTAVKKTTGILCEICWIHLIVQNRKREKVKGVYPGKWHVFVLALIYLFECLNK